MLAVDTQSGALELYDFGTRKWEELTKLQGGSASWSKDSQCIYFNGGMTPEGKELEYRLCLRDRKAQVVADLAEVGPTMSMLGGWSGVTPDGSILAVHDISLEEIYSAELDLP
jgi:hypothetical protein